jgi:hypothetical protein
LLHSARWRSLSAAPLSPDLDGGLSACKER